MCANVRLFILQLLLVAFLPSHVSSLCQAQAFSACQCDGQTVKSSKFNVVHLNETKGCFCQKTRIGTRATCVDKAILSSSVQDCVNPTKLFEMWKLDFNKPSIFLQILEMWKDFHQEQTGGIADCQELQPLFCFRRSCNIHSLCYLLRFMGRLQCRIVAKWQDLAGLARS